MGKKALFVGALIVGVALLGALSSLMLWHPLALASEATSAPVGAASNEPAAAQWAYLAAALVTGIASLGAAYAVATVGTAAVGALTEKPELFGRVIILVGLAEGIAIYGVIISVIILNRLG